MTIEVNPIVHVDINMAYAVDGDVLALEIEGGRYLFLRFRRYVSERSFSNTCECFVFDEQWLPVEVLDWSNAQSAHDNKLLSRGLAPITRDCSRTGVIDDARQLRHKLFVRARYLQVGERFPMTIDHNNYRSWNPPWTVVGIQSSCEEEAHAYHRTGA